LNDKAISGRITLQEFKKTVVKAGDSKDHADGCDDNTRRIYTGKRRSFFVQYFFLHLKHPPVEWQWTLESNSENDGLSFTVYGQDHESVSMQVPYQPDETRLIGADCKQRGSRIHPYHRHLKRARCVKGVLIHLAANRDLVGTNIVHSL
jgi:hypothetical protein